MPGLGLRGPTKLGYPEPDYRQFGYGGPIEFTNIGRSNEQTDAGTPNGVDLRNATDQASYLTGVWTPPYTDGIVLIAVQNSYNGSVLGGPQQATVFQTTSGLRWSCLGVQRYGVVGAASARVLTFYAIDASRLPGGESTTIDFTEALAGSPSGLISSCDAQFSAVRGVDLSDGISNVAVQRTGAANSAGSGVSTNFAAKLRSPYNRIVACFGVAAQDSGRLGSLTDGMGWIVLDNWTGAGPLRGLTTGYRPDEFDTTATSAIAGNVAGSSSTFHGILALELRAKILAPDGSYIDAGPSWVNARSASATVMKPARGPVPYRIFKPDYGVAAGPPVVTGVFDGRSQGRAEAVAKVTTSGVVDARSAGRSEVASLLITTGRVDARSMGRAEAVGSVSSPGLVTGVIDARSGGRSEVAAKVIVSGATDARSQGRAEARPLLVVIGRSDARSRGRSEILAGLLVQGRSDMRSQGRSEAMGTVITAGTVFGRFDGRSSSVGSLVGTTRGPLIISHEGPTAGAAAAGTILREGVEGVLAGAAPSGTVLLEGANGTVAGGAPAGAVLVEGQDGPRSGAAPAGGVLIESAAG